MQPNRSWVTTRIRWRLRRVAAHVSGPVIHMASRQQSRRYLNAVYGLLGPTSQALVHESYAKLFREGTGEPIEDGVWSVRFAGKIIHLPITVERAWLDWDIALSILGHDCEVKQTYAAILQSSSRPDVFLDIGANYGTHSLLFLVHGVDALSFEPNPVCAPYLMEVCHLNYVSPKLFNVALGEKDGNAELLFPEGEEWLGSTDPEIQRRLADRPGVKKIAVVVQRLDNYIADVSGRRVLIKLDTEGNELSVLRGGAAMLQTLKPAIIFESFAGPQREALDSFLAAHEYRTYRLPWRPRRAQGPLAHVEFLSSEETNFVALPNQGWN